MVDYQTKGHSVELLGSKDVEGTEAHHIKVTKANGDVEDWYLDTEYNLPFRVESTAEIQGQQVETAQTLGDYKEVGDLVFAHSVSVAFGPGGQGGQQSFVIDEVNLNVDVDQQAFVMPAAEEEPPAAE